MKKILSCIALLLNVVSALAQGTVTFFPTPSTLSSVDTGSGNVLTSGAAGSYYYGLLISATPTGPFTFTGNYATNLAVPGYFGSLTAQTVNGWPAGATMAFAVAMWSSSLGHDFQPSWLTTPILPGQGYFGVSLVAVGASGGLGTPATPPLPLFGSTTISRGVIGTAAVLVPEPNSTALVCASVATLVVFGRRRQRSAS